MTTLHIGVYDSAAEVPMGYPLEVLTVSIGGASAQSSAITTTGMATKRCRLFAQADCYFVFGENPTASSSDQPLGNENPEYFWAKAGDKVAVIQRS